MGRKLRVVMLAVAVMATCLLAFAGPAAAIQFGQPDGAAHPYVCLVVFYDEDDAPLWRTTGELIAPGVVLTAGHGTVGTSGARVWFWSDIPTSPPGGYPYGGPGSYHGTPYTNPDYREVPLPGLPGFDYHDVGIVVLDEPVSADRYGLLPTAGAVGGLRVKQPLDIVGYGVNYRDPGGGLGPYDQWRWNRARYYAPTLLVETRSKLSSEFMKLACNPAQGKGGGTFGDSGGPALLAGTDTILGITAFGTNNPCMGVGYYQRIDIPDVLAWIEGFIPD
jgi:hypothetical protein